MKAALADLSARLTARKGNHPILWILFGAVVGAGAGASLLDGTAAVPVPRLGRALQGDSASRFKEVSLAAEPALFLGGIAAALLLAAACLAIGGTGLVLRARARKHPHPLTSVATRRK